MKRPLSDIVQELVFYALLLVWAVVCGAAPAVVSYFAGFAWGIIAAVAAGVAVLLIAGRLGPAALVAALPGWAGVIVGLVVGLALRWFL